MKKLLATTALAGVVLGGSAFAQTTITGELRIGLKAISIEGTGDTSKRGFGNEMQINVQTKGKTNVGGLDYAAGFAMENDGDQATTLFNENTYFDFTNASSGTTLSIQRDHMQRSDSARNAAVMFGFDSGDIIDGAFTDNSSVLFQASPGAAPGASFGIGIIQDVGKLGKVSYLYVPERGSVGDSESTPIIDSESAYEIGFVGGLGVTGLNVYAFKNQMKMIPGQTKKAEAKNFGASYNIGQITAGYEYTKHNHTNTQIRGQDIKEKSYGLAYAVNKDLSVMVTMADAQRDTSATKAKTKSLQLGYNLGPVALTVGVGEFENARGTTAVAEDSDKVGFARLIGAF
jgi:hypothetical protein